MLTENFLFFPFFVNETGSIFKTVICLQHMYGVWKVYPKLINLIASMAEQTGSCLAGNT